MTGVLISCAGDNDLAKRLYNFLVSAYPDNTDMISLNEDEITIQSEKLSIRNDDVRESLAKFQATNADLDQYTIIEFADTFTIGIPQNLDELVISCELCGLLVRSEVELDIHRRIHWLVPIY
jgi:hypothetical protein